VLWWEEVKVPVCSMRRARKLKKLSDTDNDEIQADQTTDYIFYNSQEILRPAVNMISSRVDSIEHSRVVKRNIGRVVPTAKPDLKHKIVRIMQEQ
jgi:hypothetical protein